MKKTFSTALICSGLLVLLLVGTQIVEVTQALTPYSTYYPGDPYTTIYTYKEIPPPANANARLPTVSILSPTNNTAIASNNVTIVFNVESTSYFIYLGPAYYKASWQSDNVTIDTESLSQSAANVHQLSVNVTNVPEGPCGITVYADAIVEYLVNSEEVVHPNTPTSIILIHNLIITSTVYRVMGSSTVNFTIDTSPPKISKISMENETFNSTTVPLSFNVNEETSQLSYSIDNQEKVTIYGNTTLTNLTEGTHNLEIYANDSAGNIAVSTANFTIKPKPSPSPSASPSPTPSASLQPTQSPEPSATSISSTEIILVAVVVVIAVSIAALAISKRNKRKV